MPSQYWRPKNEIYGTIVQQKVMLPKHVIKRNLRHIKPIINNQLRRNQGVHWYTHITSRAKDEVAITSRYILLANNKASPYQWHTKWLATNNKRNPKCTTAVCSRSHCSSCLHRRYVKFFVHWYSYAPTHDTIKRTESYQNIWSRATAVRYDRKLHDKVEWTYHLCWRKIKTDRVENASPAALVALYLKCRTNYKGEADNSKHEINFTCKHDNMKRRKFFEILQLHKASYEGDDNICLVALKLSNSESVGKLRARTKTITQNLVLITNSITIYTGQ